MNRRIERDDFDELGRPKGPILMRWRGLQRLGAQLGDGPDRSDAEDCRGAAPGQHEEEAEESGHAVKIRDRGGMRQPARRLFGETSCEWVPSRCRREGRRRFLKDDGWARPPAV